MRLVGPVDAELPGEPVGVDRAWRRPRRRRLSRTRCGRRSRRPARHAEELRWQGSRRATRSRTGSRRLRACSSARCCPSAAARPVRTPRRGSCSTLADGAAVEQALRFLERADEAVVVADLVHQLRALGERHQLAPFLRGEAEAASRRTRAARARARSARSRRAARRRGDDQRVGRCARSISARGRRRPRGRCTSMITSST